MRFIVTVENNSKQRIQEIAQVLANMGNRIDHVLKITGIITGFSPNDESLQNLKVDGVKSVEKDRAVSIR